MDKAIIDTSAWIESFRPKGSRELGDLVRDHILAGAVLLPGIIRTEILRGARNNKDYDYLTDLLKGLEYLPVAETFWDRLSRFSFDLFKNGISVPLTDAYIALLCIERNAGLIHNDRHFGLIAEHSPLRIIDIDR